MSTYCGSDTGYGCSEFTSKLKCIYLTDPEKSLSAAKISTTDARKKYP